MSIVNGQGLVVATYKYDPYGNLVSSEPAANSSGAINPIRYRGYYYDTDSQLYYLQSRYYDPELGRFLNADAFASTGQGIIGCNMFAYCNNNPVNYIDPAGALSARQIHDEVLREICFYNTDLQMTDTCIYYNKKDHKNKWGFCDLVNLKTGEVWELKRHSSAPSCQKSAAIQQLGGYLCGCLKHHKEVSLTSGTTKIPSGMFTRTDSKGSYFIWYWDAGNGILFYDYIFTPKQDVTAHNAALAGLGIEIVMIIALGLYINTMNSAITSQHDVVSFGPFSNVA